MGNRAIFHTELWDCLLKMADEEESLRNLMKSAIDEVNNRFKFFESSEIKEETFRETLPEGYTYNIEELSGVERRFKAHFVADGITKDNINQWVAEYEWCYCQDKGQEKAIKWVCTPPLLTDRAVPRRFLNPDPIQG